MRKMLGYVLMLAVMVALSGSANTVALAQGTKKTKDKDTKTEKVTKGTKAGTGTIEISEGKDGKFRFSVRDGEGKYLGGSGPLGYPTVKAATEAIERLKEVIASAKITKGTPAKKAPAKKTDDSKEKDKD